MPSWCARPARRWQCISVVASLASTAFASAAITPCAPTTSAVTRASRRTLRTRAMSSASSYGLRTKSSAPASRPGDDVARGDLAGDEDDRQGDGPRVGAEPAADVEAVQPGQPDVEEDEVGVLLDRGAQRIPTVGDRDRSVAGSFEQSCQQRSIRDVVLGDEDELTIEAQGHRRPPEYAGMSPRRGISAHERALQTTVRRSRVGEFWWR